QLGGHKLFGHQYIFLALLTSFLIAPFIWYLTVDALFVAFTFLSWQEQLRYLELACHNTDVSITLLHQTKDIPEKLWQRVFRKACEEKNQTTLYMCLNLVIYRGFHLPKSCVALLASYYPFSIDRMNTAFMGVANCTYQLEMVKAVVDSAFNANEIKNHADYQRRYGSAILIEGARLGLLPQENALARAESRFAINGVHFNSVEYKHEILQFLEDALQGNSTAAHLKSLDSEIELADFRVFQTISPGFVTRWGELIEQARRDTLQHYQRTVLLFSVYLRKDDTVLAEKILAKVQFIAPSMNFSFSKPEYSLKSYAYWYGIETAALNELRLKQLLLAQNDDVLAKEVLSALIQSKARLLFEQASTMLQRPEPVHTARALMILGFSDVNSEAEQLLSHYSKEKGLVGDAYDAAIFAYSRNKWSRHWFKLMTQAQQAVDFWRYSILFTKIVDDRYYNWYQEYENHSEVFNKFKYTFNDPLRSRIKSWQDKRKKMLFGEKVPEAIFFGDGQ
ncbi:MAG: hypothetical protein MJK04_32500, partial [Psychrosphaera sp.]|nr:hypothetical protein [Psychrosphaera sp.]